MFEINKDYKNANISRTIRFTDEIFDELSKLSEKEDISFNLLVLQCCRYALSNIKTDKKDIPNPKRKRGRPKKF